MTRDRVEACPECDSAKSLYHRKQKTPEWKCFECGAEFDEPRVRESKREVDTGGGTPELLDIDADAYPDGGTAVGGEIDVGAVVADREHSSGEHAGGEPRRMVVINTPPVPADEWDVTNYGTTVADDNPGYDPKDDVSVCVREDDLDEKHPIYRGERPLRLVDLDIWFKAFPVGRLRLLDHRAGDVRGGDQ